MDGGCEVAGWWVTVGAVEEKVTRFVVVGVAVYVMHVVSGSAVLEGAAAELAFVMAEGGNPVPEELPVGLDDFVGVYS